MAKPPATPPSSDIAGVNRDARVGAADRDPVHSDPGGAIDRAGDESKAKPDEGKPDESPASAGG